MLNEVTIGNFKSFGFPQSLQIRRINTVFGPNSAGKSSFIHALLLAQSAFRTGNFDVRRISSGVDLGGFRAFVHGQDTQRDMELSFEVIPQKHKANGGIRSVNVSLSIGYHFGRVLPKCIRYSVDGQLLLELRVGEHDPNLHIAELNSGSQIFQAIGLKFADQIADLRGMEVDDRFRNAVNKFIEDSLEGTVLMETTYLFTDSYRRAMERLAAASHAPKPTRHTDPWVKPELRPLQQVHDPLAVVQILRNKAALQRLLGNSLDDVFFILESPQASDFVQRLRRGQYPKSGEPKPQWWEELFAPGSSTSKRIADASAILHGVRRLRQHLQEIITALQSYVAEDIDSTVHIGPLRWYPEKVIEGEPLASHHESATGEAAWLQLVEDNQLLGRVNVALERLGMGYSVSVRALYEHDTVLTLLDARVHSPSGETLRQITPDRKELVLIDTHSGLRVRHRDVGVGVSQVLPVIVSTLASHPHQLTSIEQPELHLHPRLQTELADIFVEAANSGRTVFLETHSEHLLLRLLRRVRETTNDRANSPGLRLKASHLQVVYAEPTRQGTILRPLEITPQGEFAEFWPEGFFADRSEELY